LGPARDPWDPWVPARYPGVPIGPFIGPYPIGPWALYRALYRALLSLWRVVVFCYPMTKRLMSQAHLFQSAFVGKYKSTHNLDISLHTMRPSQAGSREVDDSTGIPRVVPCSDSPTSSGSPKWLPGLVADTALAMVETKLMAERGRAFRFCSDSSSRHRPR